MDDDVTAWLLDTDPALRWQVERDLLGEDESVWQATRARVASEGRGALLLARQDEDGRWAAGSHFPTRVDHPVEADDREAQPWIATSWGLKSLREWGVDSAAMGDTYERIERSAVWEYDDLPFWDGEVDVCINAFTLASAAWLGHERPALLAWFDEHRLSDGGWNCAWEEGSVRSSFHSTLNALIGLREYQECTGVDTRAMRAPGEEYLLVRHLLDRRSTGERVGAWATTFEYPHRWRYSVLRALDHFRAASLLDVTAPDPRLADAVEIVRAARTESGRWLQQRRDPGAVWFHEDVPAGEESPWLTLIALRVLSWWDERTAASRNGK